MTEIKARVPGGWSAALGAVAADGPYWIWSEITPESGHWRNVVSWDEGESWQLGEEMRLRRLRAALR